MDTLTKITVGFTESNRATGYSSFDGYMVGAQQTEVEVEVPSSLVMAVPHTPGITRAERVAEAVFYASNSPYAQNTPLGYALFSALSQVPGLRSLSVGDTVTIEDTRLSCDRWGWSEIHA
jgi:hypothetical protein